MTFMLVAAVSQHGMDDDHMGGWGWGMLAFVILLVIAVVGVLIYFVARDSGGRGGRSGPDPVDVLDHRFARGEIDEEEYRNRRDILRG
jgi:putative membrane protein